MHLLYILVTPLQKFWVLTFLTKQEVRKPTVKGFMPLPEAVLKDFISFYLSLPLFSAFSFVFIVVKLCSFLSHKTNSRGKKGKMRTGRSKASINYLNIFQKSSSWLPPLSSLIINALQTHSCLQGRLGSGDFSWVH